MMCAGRAAAAVGTPAPTHGFQRIQVSVPPRLPVPERGVGPSRRDR
jgi:hypothetical protein